MPMKTRKLPPSLIKGNIILYAGKNAGLNIVKTLWNVIIKNPPKRYIQKGGLIIPLNLVRIISTMKPVVARNNRIDIASMIKTSNSTI